jgi:xanthine dehydrogenase accessory factor
MEAALGPLLPLFGRERAAGRALALGVLVDTAGSTYRKPGALMLIAANGEYAGLISGGCLEGDLREHARAVIETGAGRVLRYDLRASDDLLWGLGLGCEGAMQILLLQSAPADGWQPLGHLAEALAAHRATAVAVLVESSDPALAVGRVVLPGATPGAPGAPAVPAGTPARALPAVQAALDAATAARQVRWLDDPTGRWFLVPLSLPPRILLLGAGPDALPVVEFAARLDWKVTLADHRPAYAVAAHFPSAERVVLTRPEELSTALALERFDAAVVMSHHLPSDLAYLRALAASVVPYVGLLGPPARRERLIAELGCDAERLRTRLHAPVGLPLGGRTPESIALAIVAQLHSFVHGAGESGPAGVSSAPRVLLR